MPYVYRLRGGLEGAEVPAGRQGRQPRRDDEARPARTPGLHDHDRRVQGLHGRRRHHPRRPHGRGRRGARRARGEDGQAPRRRRRPAARLGALGRAVLDAGDDGHRPQPRSQRRVRGRPGQADRQRALRLRLVPPLRADVRQDRARRRRRAVRGGARGAARGAGRRHRPRALGRGSRGSRRPRSRRSCSREAGIEFPQDPHEQLRLAIEAVFRSWNGERARIYRRMEKIPDDLGTAVNVQTMVFGNKGDDSGTGVAFTRDPATGENRPYGDFLQERAGRGRRGRHPRHRAARRDGQRVPRVPPAAARR